MKQEERGREVGKANKECVTKLVAAVGNRTLRAARNPLKNHVGYALSLRRMRA